MEDVIKFIRCDSCGGHYDTKRKIIPSNEDPRGYWRIYECSNCGSQFTEEEAKNLWRERVNIPDPSLPGVFTEVIRKKTEKVNS